MIAPRQVSKGAGRLSGPAPFDFVSLLQFSADSATIPQRFHDEFDAMLAVALELDDPHPMEDLSAKSDEALTTLDGPTAIATWGNDSASLEVPVEE